MEPKHTQKIKEIIVDNIEKRKVSSLSEMDELLKDEYCERIYRNHHLNKEEMKKLKKIKSPSIILLISNKPEHEIAKKLKNIIRKRKQKIKFKLKRKWNIKF